MSYPEPSDKITLAGTRVILKAQLARQGGEFVREMLSGVQPLGDDITLITEEPAAYTAKNGREKQSLSQSLVFPVAGRLLAVSAHGNASRHITQQSASPLVGARRLAGGEEGGGGRADDGFDGADVDRRCERECVCHGTA